MSRFWLGFGSATVLYAAGGLVYVGVFSNEEPADPAWVAPAEADADAGPKEEPPRRRKLRSRGKERDTTSGTGGWAGAQDDDLGAGEAREVDMNAGEEQLSNAEIESTMGGALGRLRRCLMLAAGEETVRGRLVFGLRIEPTGAVSRVNLRGPSEVTSGESGACLRDTARAVHFRSFDGPAMIVSYPITLE